MPSDLRPEQLQLYLAIDEIVWREWESMGAGEIPEGKDEYYVFLPHILKLALRADRDKIAEYLHSVAAEDMGLRSTLELQRSIADKILAAKAASGAAGTDEGT